MRQRHLVFLLGGAILVGGALAACGGDSSGPRGVACTGNTPDLTGIWTLDTIEFVGVDPPRSPPEATGSFVFTGDSVHFTVVIPSASSNITGDGTCILTATTLYINGSGGALNQASGPYTFADAATDTLRASLLTSGQIIRLVAER